MRALDMFAIVLALFALFYELQFLGGLHISQSQVIPFPSLNSGLSHEVRGLVEPLTPLIVDLDQDGVNGTPINSSALILLLFLISHPQN